MTVKAEERRIRAGVKEHRHPGKFDFWHPVRRRHLWTAPLHLTTRSDSNGVLLVEIPQDSKNFPTGTPVIIAPEKNPEAQIHTKVWGGKRRYVTVLLKRQHSAEFTAAMDVTVRLDLGVE